MEIHEEAARYCALIERADSLGREALVAELAASLASVLAAASQLPDVPATEVELPDVPSRDAWRERFAVVQRALGEWDSYWTTMASHADDARDAVMLPLGDDLADIWLDLKQGLLALEAGISLDDVMWEWRFSFYSHWGRHATEALRALHARLADDGGPMHDRADR